MKKMPKYAADFKELTNTGLIKINFLIEEAAELNEMKKAVMEAIALLPENYREVIEMRFYRGLKGIEIAERLGVSSTRVTRIIQDAVNLIKKRLAEKRIL
ncbi:MAG TPA: sigma-70 family RNA polymerase sigma factor [Vampirovibrionales bacterium]